MGVEVEGFGRHFLVRVGMEVGTISLQYVHQQQFRGKWRRGYLISKKCLESLSKCGAELHRIADGRLSIAD